MKKAIIILAIVAVIAFAVWYFVFNTQEPKDSINKSSTGNDPNDDKSITVSDGAGETLPVESGPVTSVDIDHANETVNITTAPPAIAPELTLLRSKQWNAEIYTGSLNRNDTAGFNYATSFAPVSDPLAIMGYNDENTFEAKGCGSPSECTIYTISKSAFPFKITYGFTNSFESFVSSDYKTILLVDGTNVIKKITEGTGVVVSQGESNEIKSVPLIQDLQNLYYNTEVFGASAYRSTYPYYQYILNFNPFFGDKSGVRISINTGPDLNALICRQGSGDANKCTKELITKETFPYIITYPDKTRSNGLPYEMSYISSNLRTIYFGKHWEGTDNTPRDSDSDFRVFKKLTR